MSESDLSAYLSKCFNKLSDINTTIRGIRQHYSADDVRESTKRDLATKLSDYEEQSLYWEDEYWLTIEALNRLREDNLRNNGLDYSNNN